MTNKHFSKPVTQRFAQDLKYCNIISFYDK